MSPVLGAVASVMNVFEDFEDRPKFTYRPEAGPWVKTGLGAEIGSAGTEGKFSGTDRSEKGRFNQGASDLAQAA
jgi:hypothetical protein